MQDVEFAYLMGKPTASAQLKAEPEHFRVSEQLGYSLAGEGEHWMVRLQKTGENTSFVANELAKACGVKSKDIGWAGLKDRHAVTEQWFSVHLPKGDPDIRGFLAQYPHIKQLETTRHNKKLRPGELAGNQFVLTLTQVTDIDSVVERLEKIKHLGVPNYFGEQRFGRERNNVIEARRWGKENVRTRNANKRSLYLSAARSWIFNRVLSERVLQNGFTQVWRGDNLNLGQQSELALDNLEAYQSLVEQRKAWITGALAGDNALPTQADCLALEQRIIDDEPDLMALIRGNRMRHDRRNLSVHPDNLSWSVNSETSITLSFDLPSGSYATSVVRELVNEIPVERQY